MSSHTHLCMCMLTSPHGDDERVDFCVSIVGPDQPMCDACMSVGHHLSPRQVPLSDPRRRR